MQHSIKKENKKRVTRIRFKLNRNHYRRQYALSLKDNIPYVAVCI